MEAASAYLPDDVVIEILARLPAKQLCRFKCVSRTWRRLISDLAHSDRFAQTLSGLFYYRHRPHDGAHRPCFAGLRAPPPPGVDTALSFLPPSCAGMELLDSCNGLLLLRSSRVPWSPRPRFYVVCNPATGDWVTLPQPSHAPGEMCYDDAMMADKNTCVAALGFDPATSLHFHVFQLVEKEDQFVDVVVAMEIYSSETGKWILKESGWSKSILCNLQMTYLNGFLHFGIIDDDAVASVDTKGQTWRVTHVQQRRDDPDDGGDGFVGHSQGRLLYVDANLNDDSISIYVLEDHDDRWEWTLKHSVSKLDLIQPRKSPRGVYFGVAAIHPDDDLIYFYEGERLMSYDMTHGIVHVICTLSEVSPVHRPFLPYVPFYSGPLASPSAD
ncbi:F-box protein At5g49610 [Sorghum bicolor]|nr:F-box protein At5g49610 [Sorghum bicolor]|eukprot:XP_002442911.1 F-box protein At5g49610 [Sorghum bicolor]